MSPVPPLACCTLNWLDKGWPFPHLPTKHEVAATPESRGQCSRCSRKTSQGAYHCSREGESYSYCHCLRVFELRLPMPSDYITFSLKSFSGFLLLACSSPSSMAWLQVPCSPVWPQLSLRCHLPTPCTSLSNPSFTPCILQSKLHISLKVVSKLSQLPKTPHFNGSLLRIDVIRITLL